MWGNQLKAAKHVVIHEGSTTIERILLKNNQVEYTI